MQLSEISASGSLLDPSMIPKEPYGCSFRPRSLANEANDGNQTNQHRKHHGTSTGESPEEEKRDANHLLAMTPNKEKQ